MYFKSFPLKLTVFMKEADKISKTRKKTIKSSLSDHSINNIDILKTIYMYTQLNAPKRRLTPSREITHVIEVYLQDKLSYRLTTIHKCFHHDIICNI